MKFTCQTIKVDNVKESVVNTPLYNKVEDSSFDGF